MDPQLKGDCTDEGVYDMDLTVDGCQAGHLDGEAEVNEGEGDTWQEVRWERPAEAEVASSSTMTLPLVAGVAVTLVALGVLVRKVLA